MFNPPWPSKGAAAASSESLVTSSRPNTAKTTYSGHKNSLTSYKQRSPLQEQSPSQSNRNSPPSTIRLVQNNHDEQLQIRSKSPFPALPSQVFPPPRDPTNQRAPPTGGVSRANPSLDHRDTAASQDARVDSLLPKPLQPKRLYRASTSTTNSTLDGDTSFARDSIFTTASSSRFSSATTPLTASLVLPEETDEGQYREQLLTHKSHAAPAPRVPPSPPLPLYPRDSYAPTGGHGDERPILPSLYSRLDAELSSKASAASLASTGTADTLTSQQIGYAPVSSATPSSIPHPRLHELRQSPSLSPESDGNVITHGASSSPSPVGDAAADEPHDQGGPAFPSSSPPPLPGGEQQSEKHEQQWQQRSGDSRVVPWRAPAPWEHPSSTYTTPTRPPPSQHLARRLADSLSGGRQKKLRFLNPKSSASSLLSWSSTPGPTPPPIFIPKKSSRMHNATTPPRAPPWSASANLSLFPQDLPPRSPRSSPRTLSARASQRPSPANSSSSRSTRSRGQRRAIVWEEPTPAVPEQYTSLQRSRSGPSSTRPRAPEPIADVPGRPRVSSDELADTLGELGIPPLRPSNSGYLRRNNSRPDSSASFSSKRSSASTSYATSFPAWVKWYYATEGTIRFPVYESTTSLPSTLNAFIRPAMRLHNAASSESLRSMISRRSNSKRMSRQSSTRSDSPPPLPRFPYSLWRPRTRPRQREALSAHPPSPPPQQQVIIEVTPDEQGEIRIPIPRRSSRRLRENRSSYNTRASWRLSAPSSGTPSTLPSRDPSARRISGRRPAGATAYNGNNNNNRRRDSMTIEPTSPPLVPPLPPLPPTSPGVASIPDHSYHTAPGLPVRAPTGEWDWDPVGTPHLRQGHRSAAYSISAWQAPSMETVRSGFFHWIVNSNAGRQMALFVIGFVFPLAWFTGALLPLPPPARVYRASMAQAPEMVERNLGLTAEDLIVAQLGTQTQVEAALDEDAQEFMEKRYQKARWWRNVNRAMSVVGVLIIVAIIVVAAVISRINNRAHAAQTQV